MLVGVLCRGALVLGALLAHVHFGLGLLLVSCALSAALVLSVLRELGLGSRLLRLSLGLVLLLPLGLTILVAALLHLYSRHTSGGGSQRTVAAAP